MAQGLISSVFLGIEYAMIGLGLTLIFGVMRVVNLAHADFYTVGGYLTLYFAYFLGPMFGLVLSIFFAFLAGIVIDRVGIQALRKREDLQTNSMVLTLGVSLIIAGSLFFVFGSDYRQVPGVFSGTTSVIGFTFSVQELFALVISAALIVGLMALLKFTTLGLAIRATSADSTNARALGINVNHVYTISFGVGVAFAAAAGGLFGPILYVFPQGGVTYLQKAFIVTIMGGMGSILGALIAAFVLAAAETFAQLYVGGFSYEFVGIIAVLLILLVRPRGFLGEIDAE